MTAGEMFDELMVMGTGVVAGAAIMPGFFLCVPGLSLVIAPLLVMALATAIVVAALGLVIGLAVAPVLVARQVARSFAAQHRANAEAQTEGMSAAAA